LLCLAVTLLGLSGICAAAEDRTALLETRCSVCRPSERPKATPKSPEQWLATVSRMVGKGTELTADKK
jgi:hypothetical protein